MCFSSKVDLPNLLYQSLTSFTKVIHGEGPRALVTPIKALGWVEFNKGAGNYYLWIKLKVTPSDEKIVPQFDSTHVKGKFDLKKKIQSWKEKNSIFQLSGIDFFYALAQWSNIGQQHQLARVRTLTSVT